MASLNKVLLIGNLGADPEMRSLPSGDAVTNIRIATSTRYKDKSSGEMKELTEWHRIVFFGRLAEIAGEYLRKGSPVYVEGQIRTRKWQDQRGKIDIRLKLSPIKCRCWGHAAHPPRLTWKAADIRNQAARAAGTAAPRARRRKT